jgi:hypothetical protein
MTVRGEETGGRKITQAKSHLPGPGRVEINSH